MGELEVETNKISFMSHRHHQVRGQKFNYFNLRIKLNDIFSEFNNVYIILSDNKALVVRY